MSASRDLKNNVDASQSIAPAERTASVNGTGVDLQQFDSAMGVFNAGLWTDGSFTPKLQESDAEGSGYTDVASADLDGAFTDVDSLTTDNSVQRVGYKGNKRYIRMAVDEAGASPAASTGLVFGATIHRGHPHGAPAA